MDAEVAKISELQQQFPQLRGIDSTDITRVRFVVLLQNEEEIIVRVRCCMWNDRNLARWHNMPPTEADNLARTWDSILEYTIDNMQPKDMEGSFNVRIE